MSKAAIAPRFRVGLLGESPNDTVAVEKLLLPRYGAQGEFITMVDNVTGDNLETQGAFRQLRREYQLEKPNLVLVIRDLDDLEKRRDRVKYRRRYKFFRKVDKQVEGKGLFLLNIYTIEALIAAHIEKFNEHYGCHCVIEGDVMKIEKPIELLRAATAGCKTHYLEGHCGELLAKMDYNRLLANCRYFQKFDTDFAARLPGA
ncbi:hypothetical protein Q5H93_04845 [Hymenobacter sp. ASUV-10]|uniref:DUF4276 family protein n=1 Tax=Hymenobacter aranciens TaxID=3063996 RepID=A0ABT9B702_9BACT|nr:hypothetical protein [Hymenobacter sp. ASUV-10]MDO7874050.1 hypothetical protein [Hymenobacter sp. ASUV-10]